jgi:hypothetical protein
LGPRSTKHAPLDSDKERFNLILRF